MLKNKFENKILIIILFLSLTIFSAAHLLQAAWLAPVGEPYSGNDGFPFIPNAASDDNNYVLDRPLVIDNNFIVGANTLYVDEAADRVGVLTNNPQTSLDVWGVVRIGQMNYINFPVCSNTAVGGAKDGTIIYNLDQNRLNICVDGVWRIIGYDKDLDGWLDYVDCNDDDPNINPGSEICHDSITNDCDSLINEDCYCTASDWSTVTCPDMSACDNNLTFTPTKLVPCIGTAPVLACNCVCRPEHFVAPLPPVCPVCRASATTLYSARVSGVTCVDSNSLSDTYCSSNCSGYCNGITCCNQSTYYSCSGNYSVYHDACGGTTQTYCPNGCESGACKDASLCPCDNWQCWYNSPTDQGCICVCVP